MHILIANDEGYEARFDLPENLAEPLWVQLDRLDDAQKRAAFGAALVREFATALGEFLDPDLSPPTEKQIAFARSIARARRIAIPREALIYKTAMFAFLDTYAFKK